MHILERIGSVMTSLCAIAVLSSVAEMLLAGRKGAHAVSLMLAMAGVGLVLTEAASLIGGTD